MGLSAEGYTVQRVTKATALPMLLAHHYLGRFPNVSSLCYGLYHEGELVSVATLSIPNNMHGVARKVGLQDFNGNLELTRLVVLPDAPPNMASFALGRYMQAWRSDYDWIYSYADTGQNHHGGIYQAINAIYVGLTRDRIGFLMDGVPKHPRQIYNLFGTSRSVPGPAGEPTAVTLASKRGLLLEAVPRMNARKHLYIIPVGDKTTRRAILRKLEPFRLPYPKRSSLVV